jgi:PAS domain S-box-containing protein
MTHVQPGPRLREWVSYPATVLLMGVIALAMLAWIGQLGLRQRAMHVTSDTVRDLHTQAATAHLWLEEGLTDGEVAKLERARTNLVEASRLAQALLHGGTSEHGEAVQPLAVPAQRRQVEELTGLLGVLHASARERIGARAGVGSALDRQFNTVFEQLQDRTAELEKMVEEAEVADHAKSRRLFAGILVAWPGILGVALLGLVRRERGRRQVEAALQTSEERLTAIIGTATDAIITLNESHHVVLFNAAAEKIFGCPAAAALGEPLDRFIPVRYRESHRAHVHAYAATGVSARSMHSPRVLSGLRATGEEFPIEATISQATLAGQKLLTVILRDLTERKKAEELAQLYTQAKQRDEFKTNFIYNLSHELRTPLTTIREGVSQVTEGILGATTPEQREFLAIVLADIDRLARIINDLLDVAKIESGRIDLWLEQVNVVALAQQAARLFEPQAQAKGLTLRTEVAAPAIEVYADPDKIAQVIANLLGNALKFTTQGEVVLRLDEGEDTVACAVHDTGRGIPPDDLAKVFQKFYQVGVAPGPGGQGTGLGLHIAKGIVEAHGGALTARSEVGVGSTFTVVLPKKTV